MKNIRRIPSIVAAIAVLAFASAAYAKKSVGASTAAATGAWGAASAVLPTGPNVVAGLNVKTLMGTKLAQAAISDVLAKEADAQTAIDLVKSTCSIDLMTSVKDAVAAVGMETEEGVFFLGLDGLDEAKVTDCVKKIANDQGIEIKSKKSGNVVEYSAKGQTEKLYIGWPTKDVMAIATDPTDKKLITKYLGGKGKLMKDGDFGAALGKVKTSAMGWMVVTAKDQEIGDTGAKMTVLYAWLDDTSTTVSTEIHVVVDSADNATKLVKEINDQLPQLQKDTSMPKSIAKLMKTIKVSASDKDITVSASASETDVEAALTDIMSMM